MRINLNNVIYVYPKTVWKSAVFTFESPNANYWSKKSKRAEQNFRFTGWPMQCVEFTIDLVRLHFDIEYDLTKWNHRSTALPLVKSCASNYSQRIWNENLFLQFNEQHQFHIKFGIMGLIRIIPDSNIQHINYSNHKINKFELRKSTNKSQNLSNHRKRVWIINFHPHLILKFEIKNQFHFFHFYWSDIRKSISCVNDLLNQVENGKKRKIKILSNIQSAIVNYIIICIIEMLERKISLKSFQCSVHHSFHGIVQIVKRFSRFENQPSAMWTIQSLWLSILLEWVYRNNQFCYRINSSMWYNDEWSVVIAMTLMIEQSSNMNQRSILFKNGNWKKIGIAKDAKHFRDIGHWIGCH